MKQFYTYIHCKPDGTPFYVGKGHDGARKRSHHFGGRNTHHKNIVAKYGKENIGVFVFHCDSEGQAFADEIQQIAQLRREGYILVNKTNGGEGTSGYIPSEETKKKQALSRTGLKRKPETGKRISAALKGIPKSEEAKEKMRAASKIRWGKKEERENASRKSSGNKNCLGRVLSDDTKSKIGERHKGKILSSDHKSKFFPSGNKKRWGEKC